MVFEVTLAKPHYLCVLCKQNKLLMRADFKCPAPYRIAGWVIIKPIFKDCILVNTNIFFLSLVGVVLQSERGYGRSFHLPSLAPPPVGIRSLITKRTAQYRDRTA